MTEEMHDYMKREENGALSVHATISVSANTPLLVAPQGGCTLLRFHVLPQEDLSISGSDYWVLVLKVYDPDGTEKRTIDLINCGLNVLPFSQYRTMTWPPVGRFDERVDSGQSVHVVGSVTGSPGADNLRGQLDYLRGQGR